MNDNQNGWNEKKTSQFRENPVSEFCCLIETGARKVENVL